MERPVGSFEGNSLGISVIWGHFVCDSKENVASPQTVRNSESDSVIMIIMLISEFAGVLV